MHFEIEKTSPDVSIPLWRWAESGEDVRIVIATYIWSYNSICKAYP
jgi:hypothetical protein